MRFEGLALLSLLAVAQGFTPSVHSSGSSSSVSARKPATIGVVPEYVALAGIQAGTLGATADMVSQRMSGAVELEHVAAMSLLACLLSGATNSVWMRHLEERFPGPSNRAVGFKTLCDYCFCATCFNAAFLIGVPWLTDLFAGGAPSIEDLPDGFTLDGFKSLMRLEACTFVPYNTFAFRLLPTDLRPLGAASLSAVCTIVLSRVTLGMH